MLFEKLVLTVEHKTWNNEKPFFFVLVKNMGKQKLVFAETCVRNIIETPLDPDHVLCLVNSLPDSHSILNVQIKSTMIS
jgi:hypothetical protein